MKIAVVLDSKGECVTHGVDRTAEATVAALRACGHDAALVTTKVGKVLCHMPGQKHVPLYLPLSGVRAALRRLAPDTVVVLTEGFLGIEALLWAKRHHVPVVMSYNTKWPEYLARYSEKYFGIRGAHCVKRATYALLARLYRIPDCTLVATLSLRDELVREGFRSSHIHVWGRGVDTDTFYPRSKRPGVLHGKENVILYVGRVSAEKNLDALCALSGIGTVVVVGDGPARKELEARYTRVLFVGHKAGKELAEFYSAADVFAFPSCTDTFGLVMLEALACGTPVAAYPVTGPNEVVTSPDIGCLHADLRKAVVTCLAWRGSHRDVCIEYAKTRNWEAVTRRLASVLEQVARPH